MSLVPSEHFLSSCDCITHLQLKGITDWTALLNSINGSQEPFSFVTKELLEGKKVLVHCSVGENRSVAFVVAYLIHQFQMTYSEAVGFMQKKYPKMQLSEEMQAGLKMDAESFNRRRAKSAPVV